jgi:ABC-type uncharacterized transport system permease subunit
MKRKQKRKLIRIIAALVLFFAALIPDLIFGWESLIPNQNFAWLLPFGIYFAIYILISYDIFFRIQSQAFKYLNSNNLRK